MVISDVNLLSYSSILIFDNLGWIFTQLVLELRCLFPCNFLCRISVTKNLGVTKRIIHPIITVPLVLVVGTLNPRTPFHASDFFIT